VTPGPWLVSLRCLRKDFGGTHRYVVALKYRWGLNRRSRCPYRMYSETRNPARSWLKTVHVDCIFCNSVSKSTKRLLTKCIIIIVLQRIRSKRMRLDTDKCWHRIVYFMELVSFYYSYFRWHVSVRNKAISTYR